MDRTTGRRITGIDHLRQSIVDILTTPQGSRLERRTYGSILLSLVDAPSNSITRLRCYAAIASALMKWEPRVRVTRVGLEFGPEPGQADLELWCEYKGSAVSLSVPLLLRGAA